MKELSKEERFNEFIRLFTREEAYRRIEEMFKPKVTKEFVEKWAELIDTDPHRCTEISLKQMLTEAGVEEEK